MTQMNKALTNKEIKEAVLYAVTSYCQASGKKIQLPIPVKAIAKSFKSIRVITYSRLIKDNNISLEQLIKHCKTEDAYTDYDAISDTYIIYYNDITHSKTASNRFRWNIAHELGHILLNHHKNYKHTRLFRSELSSEEYTLLEDEAERFAAYLLVPHFFINFYEIRSYFSIMNLCKISRPASIRRYREYVAWKRHSKEMPLTNFDISIWKLAFGTVKCTICNSVYYGVEEQHFCKICGNQLYYAMEESKLVYSRIDMDESNKPKECPICGNEQYVKDGDYCQICGTSIYNNCVGAIDDQFRNTTCSDGLHLSGEARFCPYCGCETTYLRYKILKPYTEEKDKPQDTPYPF